MKSIYIFLYYNSEKNEQKTSFNYINRSRRFLWSKKLKEEEEEKKNK